MKNPFKKINQDQFSNQALQKFLEGLEYTHAEDGRDAWEIIKIKNIENQSLVWAKIIASLGRFPLGEFSYYITGNRLERRGKSIKLRNKPNPLVKLSAPLKIWIKKKSNEKGLVYKVS